MNRDSIGITVSKPKNKILQLVENVDAEIVNVPKFLVAYPFMGRFPTRSASDFAYPAIGHHWMTFSDKPYREQILRSWFINFSNGTVTGNSYNVEDLELIRLEAMRLASIESYHFRVDPNEDDMHLCLTEIDGHQFTFLLGSSRDNGEILKMTIIDRIVKGGEK